MMEEHHTLAEQIAAWSDKLRDVSAMALLFCQNLHDRAAFQAVQDVALDMLALAGGQTPAELEPLRDTLLTRPTPLVVGDAAVIDDRGYMLLIRRADNGQWAMPGGALEVGETPAEGVAREALEETGVACRPVALVGVFDSRLCGTVSRFHLYQFVYLCRPLPTPPVPPSHAIEVLESGWFPESALPEGLDPGHASRIPHAFRVWRGDPRPFVDGVPLSDSTDGLSRRLYAGPEDLEAIAALLLRVRPAERIAEYPGLVDLYELLSLSGFQRATCLWERAGRLIAFACVDAYNNLLFELEPAGDDTHLVEDEIVAWGEQCVKNARDAAEGEPVTLDASCREDHVDRIAFLERHGFERQAVRTLHLSRPLDTPIAEPCLPPGFRICPAAEVGNAEILAALDRAAFGTENVTTEQRQAMMDVPGYRPELDLVVVAPDGRPAANCVVSISEDENARSGRRVGYTDPVATHPDFQRRGLARALLLTGLRLLAEQGMSEARLGTSNENVGMQAVAQSVGFVVDATTVWFSKYLAV